ncbi:MAG: ribonuclease H family protein [Thiomicrorhabdus sp.]|nr:ribonuclease H family protein [Thiomicrorhabdus sp.]
MAKKFYVVWQGRTPGIYRDWNSCKQQVEKFAGAKYKSFPTLSEAEEAFKTGRSSSTKGTDKKIGGGRKKSTANGVKTYTAAEIAQMPINVKIYTDGGCDPNPGKAGSGMAVYRDDALESLWYGCYNPAGTNNTAELNALNQAFILAQTESEQGHSVAIFCDSKYAIQCIIQWAVGWQKKGWTKAGGEIKNLGLIQEMFERYQAIKNKVQVLHVNGHVGVEGNELADRMSMIAIQLKELAFIRYQEEKSIAQILSLRAG